MRIAIISDIHGNRVAFDAVMRDLHCSAPDRVIQGGDLANGGSHPAEILDRVRDLGWSGVYGNADEALWAPQRLAQFLAPYPSLLAAVEEIAAHARECLGPHRLAWLQSLPLRHTEAAVTVVHASPFDPWRAPLAQARDADLERVYRPLAAPVVVYGHIHDSFVRYLPGLTVANSGSVSLSQDGDPRASYLLLDVAAGGRAAIHIRRIAYDLDAATRDLDQAVCPHAAWTAAMLRAGHYLPPPEAAPA